MKKLRLLLITGMICMSGTNIQALSPAYFRQTQLPLNYQASGKSEFQNAYPERSRQANKDLVDLTNYYTSALYENWLNTSGYNLKELPAGLQIFAQSPFDVRGIIQLSGKTPNSKEFLKEVKQISINNKCTSLHFLQGAVGTVADDTRIGEYVLHFANGKSVLIPLIYQRNLRDLVIRKGDQIPTNADVAWTGENEASKIAGSNIQIYNYTVNNPFPDVEITSLDFNSTATESAPFLIAISMEKNGAGYRKSFRNVRIDNALLPRTPDTDPKLIDLSAYYNTSTDDDWINYPGHDFQDLPKGIQTFTGVKFDVRGMIVLASASSLSSSRVLFPERVSGIKVNQKGKKIYFLQGCGYSDKNGARIGEYIIHYSNGEQRIAPVVYGENVLDWWCKAEDGNPTDAVDAWRGSNPSTRGAGYLTHIQKYTWENPLPEVEISSIDFVTNFVTSVPFLMAVTIE